MMYMIIEDLRDNAEAVYRRLAERGRMMPEGLRYVNSWVTPDRRRCYQVMESPDPALLEQWIASWSDLVDFEVVPVISSKEAQQLPQGA